MSSAILQGSVALTLGVLAIAVLLAFVRLARGPDLANRVVALDVIAATIVAVAVISAVGTGLAVFIDVALVIALVSFLGTLALASAIDPEEPS